MQLQLDHNTAMMTKMSEDHAYDMRKMREALVAASASRDEFKDELNAARTHAAVIEADLEGTKSALQQHILSPGQASPHDLGLSAQQEDTICREWEAVVEDLKVTQGAHVTELTHELHRAEAVAADLNE